SVRSGSYHRNPGEIVPSAWSTRWPLVIGCFAIRAPTGTGWFPMSAARSPYVVQAPGGISAIARASFCQLGGTSSAWAEGSGSGQIAAILAARLRALARIASRPQVSTAAISWFIRNPLVARCVRLVANGLLLSVEL